MRRAVPIVLTAIIFAVIFARIPFGRFVAALERARFVPFVALIGSFSLFYFAIDTLVLTTLVRWFHGPIRYRDLLPARAATYLVSIVNTQLAQGALALYLHRRFATPLGELSGTIAVLILLEVTQLVLFASAGMALSPSHVPLELLAAPLAVAALWAALAIALRAPLGTAAGALARLRALPALRTFRRVSAAQLATILALKAPILLASVVVHHFALRLFGIHVPLVELLAFLPIVFMVAALPITVAHLGTSQAAWMYFFGDRAPEADLLAYSLASHLTFMLANGALGLLFLPRAYAELFPAQTARTRSTSSV